MAEKIYPASKPTGAAAPPPATPGNPNFPASKAHLYNATRPVYRPQPRRSRRSCCCSLCLWITFTIILLIVIAAIAGGVFYVLYRPHRPTFSVSSLHVSQFNLTSSNKLTTRFNFTITARNPNKKIAFNYDPISISFKSNEINVGDGTIPAFMMTKKNTTSFKTIVSVNGETVDNNDNDNDNDDNKSKLRSDLKNKKNLPLKIQLDTKVKAKIGSLKTKKLPIRVTCDGITAAIPTGKTATTAMTSGAKCKVDLRIKIWKWTI